MSEDHKDAQQEPARDSALQTTQPDQPHPPVSDQVPDETADPAQSVEVNVEAETAEVNVDNPAAPAVDGSATGD
jgi:hypothetical protein